MRAAWWSPHPPVEVTIACSEEWHRLRWQRGELLVLDHADPSGERTLAALGGERVPCISTLEAWERHEDDLRVLTWASRGAHDVLPLGSMGHGRWAVGAVGSGYRSFVSVPLRRVVPGSGANAVVGRRPAPPSLPRPPGWPPMPTSDAQELAGLFALSPTLSDRLVATVLRRWSERVGGIGSDHPAYPALAAALAGRVTMAVRAWLGRPDLEVAVDMAAPGSVAELASRDGTLRARVPFEWLSDVWAAGLGVLMGRFVLALTESGSDVERFETVGPDLSDRRQVVLSVVPPDRTPGH